MRAMLAAVIPHAGLAPDMAAFDTAVRADVDPLVRAIALCTRVVNPTDELLKSATNSEEPRTRHIATAVSQRLTDGASVYSRLKPDDLRVKPAPAPPGAAGADK
jgi:hypothetical protein